MIAWSYNSKIISLKSIIFGKKINKIINYVVFTVFIGLKRVIFLSIEH